MIVNECFIDERQVVYCSYYEEYNKAKFVCYPTSSFEVICSKTRYLEALSEIQKAKQPSFIA